MPKNGLSTESVSHDFEDPRHGALRIVDLSIEVSPGEVVGIVGRSGSGKTTIARILSGLTVPRSGTVVCDGAPIKQPDSPVVFAFQDYRSAVFPWLTVRDNINLGRWKPGDANCRRSADDAANAMGLAADLLDRFPHSVSGGERQRVQLARIMTSGARYVVVDEPTASLDQDSKQAVLKLLGSVAADRRGVVVVSHDLHEVLVVSHRIYMVRKSADGLVTMASALGFASTVPSATIEDAIGDPRFGQLYREVYAQIFGGGQ